MCCFGLFVELLAFTSRLLYPWVLCRASWGHSSCYIYNGVAFCAWSFGNALALFLLSLYISSLWQWMSICPGGSQYSFAKFLWNVWLSGHSFFCLLGQRNVMYLWLVNSESTTCLLSYCPLTFFFFSTSCLRTFPGVNICTWNPGDMHQIFPEILSLLSG